MTPDISLLSEMNMYVRSYSDITSKTCPTKTDMQDPLANKMLHVKSCNDFLGKVIGIVLILVK